MATSTFGPQISFSQVLSKSQANHYAYCLTFGRRTESDEDAGYMSDHDIPGINLADPQNESPGSKPHNAGQQIQDQINKTWLLNLVKHEKPPCGRLSVPATRDHTASNPPSDADAPFTKYLCPTPQLLMKGERGTKGLCIRHNRENSETEFQAAEILSTLFPNDGSLEDKVKFQNALCALRMRQSNAASMPRESKQPNKMRRSVATAIRHSPTPRLISSLTKSLPATLAPSDGNASRTPASIPRSLPTAASDT